MEVDPEKQTVNVLGLNDTGLIAFFVLLVVFWPLCWIPWLVRSWRANRAAPAPVLSGEQKRKVRLSYKLAGFYALALVPWPFACFMAGFMFDSPKAWPVEAVLMIVALSVLYYPVIWMAGAVLGYRSAMRDESTEQVYMKASLPLLSGMWPCVGLIGYAVLVYRAVGAPHDRPNPIAPPPENEPLA